MIQIISAQKGEGSATGQAFCLQEFAAGLKWKHLLHVVKIKTQEKYWINTVCNEIKEFPPSFFWVVNESD